jgi:hypothetical protein
LILADGLRMPAHDGMMEEEARQAALAAQDHARAGRHDLAEMARRRAGLARQAVATGVLDVHRFRSPIIFRRTSSLRNPASRLHRSVPRARGIRRRPARRARGAPVRLSGDDDSSHKPDLIRAVAGAAA